MHWKSDRQIHKCALWVLAHLSILGISLQHHESWAMQDISDQHLELPLLQSFRVPAQLHIEPSSFPVPAIHVPDGPLYILWIVHSCMHIKVSARVHS